MKERHHQSSHSGIRDEEDEGEKLALCCLLMPTVSIIWQIFSLYGILFASVLCELYHQFITNRIERQLTLF